MNRTAPFLFLSKAIVTACIASVSLAGCNSSVASSPETAGRADAGERPDDDSDDTDNTELTITLLPADIDFGSVYVGETSEIAEVTLSSNRDTGALFVYSSDKDLVILDDSCSDVELAPYEECTVEIQYSPEVNGEFDGALAIGDATGSALTDFRGSAVAAPTPEPEPAPECTTVCNKSGCSSSCSPTPDPDPCPTVCNKSGCSSSCSPTPEPCTTVCNKSGCSCQ